MDDPEEWRKLPRRNRLATLSAWNLANKTRKLLVANTEWPYHDLQKAEEFMNRIYGAFAKLPAVAALAALAFLNSAAAQTSNDEQCSLAVVSHFASKDQKVCDAKIGR